MSGPLPSAPGEDEHPSLALINSVAELPGGRFIDELTTPETATAWLVHRDLAPAGAELETYCRDRLTRLRTDLRSVFSTRATGAALQPGALDGVNRALTSAPSALLLRHDPHRGFSRSNQHPVTQLVEHAMATIAEDAATLITGDLAALIARCEAAPCDRFYLRTHARRRWCSNRCGDRVRAARAYARRH